MRLLFKTITALLGLTIVTIGALGVTVVGIAGAVLFMYAKQADGSKPTIFGQTKHREPVEYEPMTLEEIRAL